MVTLPRSVGRAMAEQLDRVNDSSARAAAQASVAEFIQRVAPDRYADPRDAEIARLTALVDQLRTRIAELELPGGHALGQRPVISAVEAAERTRLSLATVNRYLNSGFWQGEQGDDGRWLIFTDQPLLPKERIKKGR